MLSSEHSGSSKSSKNTLLAVPRVIQASQNEVLSSFKTENIRQLATFTNPQQYYKDELKESMCDSQLSKQSQDNIINIVPQPKLSNNSKHLVVEDEDGSSLRNLQSDIEHLISQGKTKMIRRRCQSIGLKYQAKSNSPRISGYTNLSPNPNNIQVQVPQANQGQSLSSQFKSEFPSSFQNDQSKQKDSFSNHHSPILELSDNRIIINKDDGFSKKASKFNGLEGDDNRKDNMSIQDSYHRVHFRSLWNYGFVYFIRSIGKFLMKGVQTSPLPITNLNKWQFQQIGDKASSFNNLKQIVNKNKKKKVGLNKQVQQQILNKFAFDPEGLFITTWSVIIIVIYLCSIFGILYQTALNIEDPLLLVISGIAQLLDILIKLNTKVYLQGKASINQLLITKEAFKKYILVDTITLGTLFVFLMNRHLFLGYFCLLRLNTLVRYTQRIKEKLSINNKYVISFLKITMMFCIVNHLIACIWLQIQNYDKIQIYLEAVYWSVGSMTNISNNQFQPINNYERIFSIILGLVGLLLYAYTFISAYLCWITDQSSLEIQSKTINGVMKMLQNKGVSQQLKSEIKHYFEFQMKEKENNYEVDDKEVFQNLSKELIRKIQMDLYGPILKQSSLLKQFCSDDCLELLSSQIQSEKAQEGKIIIPIDGVSNKLYFIVNGNVKLCLGKYNDQIQLSQIGKGKVLNEDHFLMNSPCEVNYIASSCCQLGYIERGQFHHILQQFPSDMERFQMYQDNMSYNLFYQNRRQVTFQYLQLCFQFCKICQNSNHQLMKCPSVFLSIDKKRIINEYNQAVYQVRSKFYRNDDNRFNSRLNSNLISILAIGFGLNNGFHKEQDLSNDVMNRLKGNMASDDSLFNDSDSKSNNVPDRQFTYTQINSNEVQGQGTNKSSSPPAAVQQLVIRMESEKDSKYTGTSKYSASMNSNMHEKNQTNSSIKVNVFKSNASNSDIKNSPQAQRSSKERLSSLAQPSRIQSQKKFSTSTGSINMERQINNRKLSYMSSNPPNNPFQQNTTPSQTIQMNQLNNSTSIMQQQKSLTVVNQNSTISPINMEEDCLIPISDCSNPLNLGFLKVGSSTRLGRTLDEFEVASCYKLYFPSFNVSLVAKKINKKLQSLLDQEQRSRMRNNQKQQLEDIEEIEEANYSLTPIARGQVRKSITLADKKPEGFFEADDIN